MRRFVVVIAALGLLHMVGLTPAALADVVGEGVSLLRCTESTDVKLPKKAELVQIVSTDEFEEYERVGLLIEAEVAEGAFDKGKLIATVFKVVEDGDEARLVKLTKLTARLRDGEGFAQKIVDASFGPGDELLWKLKLKGIPILSADLGDCFTAIFTVAVADEVSGS